MNLKPITTFAREVWKPALGYFSTILVTGLVVYGANKAFQTSDDDDDDTGYESVE